MAMFNFNPQQFGQFMQNPVQFMMMRRWNVPQDIENNPEKIFQHLLDTGQMNQSTYNSLTDFRKEFESRLARKQASQN